MIHRVLSRNTEFNLSEVASPAIVLAGEVAIFAVELEDGHATGARRYLFSCRKNECVFPIESDTTFAWVGVVLDEATLAPTAIGEDCHDVIVWCQKWTRFMSDVEAQSHSLQLHGTGTLTLEPDQIYRLFGRAAFWFRVVDGGVRVMGHTALRIEPIHGLLVLGDDGLLRVDVPTTIELVHIDSVSTEERLAACNRLIALCAIYLRELIDRGREKEATRLADQERIYAFETAQALRSLQSVLGRASPLEVHQDDLQNALAILGRHLQTKFLDPPTSDDPHRSVDLIESIARRSRVRMRRVRLANNWWKSDAGALLAFRNVDGRPVALTHNGTSYSLHDVDGVTKALDKVSAGEIAADAVSLYSPLPDRISGLASLGRYAIKGYARDGIWLAALALSCTLLGMVEPQAVRVIVDQAIPDADRSLIWQAATLLGIAALAQAAFAYSQGMFMLRLRCGGTSRLQAGLWDRLLRLPNSIFQKYSTGDLMNRSMIVTEISNEVSGTVLRGLLGGAFSLLNLILCIFYSGKLAVVAFVAALIVAASTATFSILIRRHAADFEQASGKLFGFVVNLVQGVGKLRVAGAEQRAFNYWARQYSQQMHRLSKIQQLQSAAGLLNLALPTLGLLGVFFLMAQLSLGSATSAKTSGVAMLSLGTFLAFHGAFFSLMGGTADLGNTLVDVVDNVAKFQLCRPLLETAPESTAESADPGRLGGSIEINNVVFRYRDDGPLILNDVSLRIGSEQFVAIVGSSGSGKSTLFRLLLGFEQPQSGVILYDRQDLAGLDLSAVRMQIGVVLQSGRINAGSMFDNIAGGNVITLDEAWEAARDAGLEDDLKAMPMGMYTVISEGGGNLSGGQRQRLMIARALSTRPRILFFDEATSALDNRTQQIVSASVSRRRVTRVVIAHRLSTIRDADFIYVLDGGRVAQAGTFDQLVTEVGLFQKLAARQLV